MSDVGTELSFIERQYHEVVGKFGGYEKKLHAVRNKRDRLKRGLVNVVGDALSFFVWNCITRRFGKNFDENIEKSHAGF